MEGVPNVVLEALSCGTRAVATRVGGIPELDQGDGMITLVPPRDSTALEEALLSIMDKSCPEIISCPTSSWQENARQLNALLFGES